MWSRRLGLLFLLGLVVAILGSLWVRVPGYMDDAYYFAIGRSLAEGRGFQEPFLWNYLDDPSGIPHPSHQYWMPLTSVIAAVSMWVLGPSFRSAQVPFLLLAALVSPLTAEIARRLHGEKGKAFKSGLLALFPGFYLPFWLTTDAFALYAVIGGLSLLLMSRAARSDRWHAWVPVGLLAGLAHLSRADGILFLLIAFGLILLRRERRGPNLIILLTAYGLAMSPWWALQLGNTGSLMGSGTIKVLWTTSYDEVFMYPPDQLTAARWWSSGLVRLLRVRVDALGANLQSLIAVNGLVFLAPLILLGAWVHRRKALTQIAAAYLSAILIVMTLVFPFAGMRGGFFHSSSALMPILWALAIPGLDLAVEKGSQWRGWERGRAERLFGAASLLLAGLLTIGLLAIRTVGPDPGRPNWGKPYRNYVRVASWFDRQGLSPSLVAVNNPPTFHLASGFRCVVVPDGGLEALGAVVRRYGVTWIILDANNPGLQSLLENPDQVPWLELEGRVLSEAGDPIMVFGVRAGVGP
jgi:4-amino-4-deoxy-L-arabinose transferase-like glycosyltransferase